MKHAEKIKQMLELEFDLDGGPSVSTLYGSQKKYSNADILIGTTKKIGTGFDEANACSDFKGKPSNVLVMVNTCKEWQTKDQFFGRIMRSDNPMIVWLYDDIPILDRHFKGLKKDIEATGGTIIDTNKI